MNAENDMSANLPTRDRRAAWLALFVASITALTLVLAAGASAAAAPASASWTTTPSVESSATTLTLPPGPVPANPHPDRWPGACVTCHHGPSWAFSAYDHANPDMNKGFHPVVGCDRCHTNGVVQTPPRPCQSCHESSHGGWNACAKCHIVYLWRLTNVAPKRHLSLAGGHKKLGCLDCHKAAPKAEPRGCVDCHGTKHGGLTTCERCHNPAWGWRPGNFDHDVFFTLVGRHTTLACSQCHPNGRFAGTPTNCVGCHGVKHGGLTRCAECHTTRRFVPTTFRHSRVFRLLGVHARLRCTKCHPQRRYASTRGNGTRCVSCHGVRHGGLTNCLRCHTVWRFVPSTFRHSSVFKLSGVHATLACTKCHARRQYARAKGTHCVDCHGVKHGGQTQCANCHSTSGWSPIKDISHPYFLVAGRHANRPCTDCHPTLVFNAPVRQCQSCHDAPHVAPTNCVRCHNTSGWSDVHFTHPWMPYHGNTGANPSCRDCHTTGNYAVYSCSDAGCHDPGTVTP